MQTPIDPARMLGRSSTVHTVDGPVDGTILAAGTRGVTLAVADDVVRFSPGEVLKITTP